MYTYIRIICFTLLLIMLPQTSTSQVVETSQEIEKDSLKIKTKQYFEPTVFSQNLFIEGGIGSSILFSQNASLLTGAERFTPDYTLSLGKWLSPFYALRLQIQGFELNGYSTVDGLYTADPQAGLIYGNNDPVREYGSIAPSDGSYRHFIRYIHTSLGVQFSTFNLFEGYVPDRKWDIVPTFGVGLFQVLEYKGIPATTTLSVNFEVMGKYQLNDQLDINMKVSGTMLPDHFEGRIAGNPYEGMMNVGVGVSYYFKKRGFKVKTCYDGPLIVEKRDTLYETMVTRDTVIVVRDAPSIEAQQIIKDVVFKFEKKSSVSIDNKFEAELKELAIFLKENPDVKIKIVGHTCDIDSYETNMKLGIERALIVKQRLIDFGAPDEQITTESKSFTEPIVPNNSEENRAINRRVELKVIE